MLIMISLVFVAVLMTALAFTATVVAAATLRGSSNFCPIKDETRIVYSLVDGVGPASKIWVEDFLWWWKSSNPSLSYTALDATALQHCDLAAYPNLRVYINPGGDAYQQLTAMDTAGAESIKRFVLRDQQLAPSAYVGFCAGGYIAAHDYLWESTYEGIDYYNYQQNPPLSLFPHTLEGSIVDINDDQYADQHGSKFRAVNVSNGHVMLYYGGSTFGWSAAPDYAAAASADFDADLEVLLYYSDFYGFNTFNLPAAWRYRTYSSSSSSNSNNTSSESNGRFNVLLTSVHPEADNCTTQQDSDCPPAGSLDNSNILQNRAWLCQYINEAALTDFAVPPVPQDPVFDTTPPHQQYPPQACYQIPYTAMALNNNSSNSNNNESSDSYAGSSSGNYNSSNSNRGGEFPLFCDDFEAKSGLSSNFQRNQSSFQYVQPWNSSFISDWNDGVIYAAAFTGAGYAVNVPQAAAPLLTASITSRQFSLATTTTATTAAGDAEGQLQRCSELAISFAYIMIPDDTTSSSGALTVEFESSSVAATTSAAIDSSKSGSSSGIDDFELIAAYSEASLRHWDGTAIWQQEEVRLSLQADSSSSSGSVIDASARLRFTCSAGRSVSSFCALDDLFVYCIR